jgi:hypothetical protein
MEDGESAFSAWLEDRVGPHALRIESRLRDESGELHGRLVLVPTRWPETQSLRPPHAVHEL